MFIYVCREVEQRTVMFKPLSEETTSRVHPRASMDCEWDTHEFPPFRRLQKTSVVYGVTSAPVCDQ
jgi:hypothetical protein